MAALCIPLSARVTRDPRISFTGSRQGIQPGRRPKWGGVVSGVREPLGVKSGAGGEAHDGALAYPGLLALRRPTGSREKPEAKPHRNDSSLTHKGGLF